MARILNDEQTLIRESVREFAEHEIRPKFMEHDKGNEFPFELNRRCGELGFIGADVPKEHGGSGLDLASSLTILEEVSKEMPALGCSLMVSMTMPLMLICDDNPDHDALVAPLISGEKIGAIAETDPAGVVNFSEWPAMGVRDGGEIVLNGTKQFVTNGHVADYVLVNGGIFEGKPAYFLVSSDMEGFTRHKADRKMGMNGAANANLSLSDVRIPASNQVNMVRFLPNLAAGYLHMSSVALGTMEGAYAKTRDWLKVRTFKKQPIVEMPQIAASLARIKTKIEASRSFIDDACRLVEKGRPDPTLIRMVKVFTTDASVECCRELIQLYGGLGYDEDAGVAHYLRDAMGTSIGDLTAPIQYSLIAKDLAKLDAKNVPYYG